jgi:hypothetical protein
MHAKLVGLAILVGALVLGGGPTQAAIDAQHAIPTATLTDGQWSSGPTGMAVQKARPRKPLRLADHRPT